MELEDFISTEVEHSSQSECKEPVQTTFIRQYENDITVCWSDSGDVLEFSETLLKRVAKIDASCVFLFYSDDHYHSENLVDALKELPDDVALCGCSSAGEVTPTGLVSGGAVAILLPRQYFTIESIILEQINKLGMDVIETRVQALRINLETKTGTGDVSDVFAVNLIDGLSYSEESATVALHRGLGGIALIGGSAGDNLKFKSTTQIHNRNTYSKSAVLVLVKSRVPFQVFTNNNFIPTEHKLVVTESDIEHRNVREFNGEPAAIAYARVIGLDPNSLNCNSFASHPVVVKVGGEYYCRSIQKCEEDHSLSFFCAIDNGIVLTVAEPTGMSESTREQLCRLRQNLGCINMILGFDCILRRIDAENRGGLENISKIYMDANVIGFGTYGEQFNSMHINQTFTGVAFGILESKPL